MLFDHEWPWNIRQIKEAVERFSVLADGPQIGVGDLAVSESAPATPAAVNLRDHAK